MKRILSFLLFVTIILMGIFFVVKQRHNSFKPIGYKPIEDVITQKTYEQGLWDGFNRTLKYLEHKNYLTKDTVKIDITEIDSVLHQKIK
jgi:hypothetical protein